MDTNLDRCCLFWKSRQYYWDSDLGSAELEAASGHCNNSTDYNIMMNEYGSQNCIFLLFMTSFLLRKCQTKAQKEMITEY